MTSSVEVVGSRVPHCTDASASPIVVDGYIDWIRFPACNFGNAAQKGFAEMQPPRVEAEVARGELELGPPIPAAASPATPGIDRQVDATPTWPRTQAVGTISQLVPDIETATHARIAASE